MNLKLARLKESAPYRVSLDPEVILKLVAIAEAATALIDRHAASALADGMLHDGVYDLLENLERALEGVT